MAIEGHLGPITPREAEYVAATIMRDHLGFKDATVTTASGDGGVDVVAKQAVAQVKHWGSQVGRPAIQQLYGARGADHSRKMVFFCSGGYSRQALAYADEVGVALFTFDAAGGYGAMNESAKEIDLRAKKVAADAKKQADREARKVEWAVSMREAEKEYKERQAAREARIKSGDIPLAGGRTAWSVVLVVAAVIWLAAAVGVPWQGRVLVAALLFALAVFLLFSERKRFEKDRRFYEFIAGKRRTP